MNKKLLLSSIIVFSGISFVAHADSSVSKAPTVPPTIQNNFGAWKASCTYAPATRTASLCIAAQQLTMQQDGKSVALGMVIVARAASTKEPITTRPYELSLMVPLGFDLTKLPTLTMDNGKPLNLPYLVCNASGCLATTQTTPSTMAGLKTAETGHIRVTRVPSQGGGTVTINYSMNHFSDALGALETWATQKAPS